MARPTVNVDEDVKEMLLELAEGERKQGEYVAQLIRNAHENRQLAISHLDLEMLKLMLEGLASRLRQQEGRCWHWRGRWWRREPKPTRIHDPLLLT